MKLASGEYQHLLPAESRLGAEQFLTVEVNAEQRGQLGDLLHLYDAAGGRVLSSARLVADSDSDHRRCIARARRLRRGGHCHPRSRLHLR